LQDVLQVRCFQVDAAKSPFAGNGLMDYPQNSRTKHPQGFKKAANIASIQGNAMNEIIFSVTTAPEGGFIAQALGHSIFTEADDLPGLRSAVRDAVLCHFDEGKAPSVIRLHRVEEEVLALA
jgi:hypothetical protein